MSIDTHEHSRDVFATSLAEFLIGTVVIASALTLIMVTGAVTLH